MIYNAILLLSCVIVAQARSRIIGGVDAYKNEFPHLVSIQLRSNGAHNCGGAVLNKQWILTAAHCIHENSNDIIVKAGKHNVKITENVEQVSEVLSTYVHEKYVKNGEVAPFDIALIKLTTPLTFNKYVSSIKLSTTEELPKNEVTIAGWGTISDPIISFPATLKKVIVPIVDLKTCNSSILAVNKYLNALHETNMCTGPVTGGHGACFGDSGSPLINRVNGHSEVIGVFSWITLPCAAPGRVSVYVKVSPFVNWINQIILNN